MTKSFPGALRYVVPDHQGQEVLGAALQEHGYSWDSEFTGGRTHLVITSRDGTIDRERVRGILSREHRTSLSGPDIIYTDVRFEDEPEGTGVPASPRQSTGTPTRAPVRPEPADPAPEPADPAPEPDVGPDAATVPLLRAALGGLLLAFPRTITDTLVVEADEGDRVLVRLLGARHLLQAVVSAARPTPTVLTAGAVTDLLHGTTALGYAVLRPDHRRAALLSAAVAFAFAASGLRRART